MKQFFSSLMLICLVAFTMPVSAQITHTANGSVDQQAEKILKQAAQKMNASAVSFNVAVVNRDSNKKQTSTMKASVLYNKGSYRVEMGTNVLYCDGTAVWHWNKEVSEVTINAVSTSDDDLMNPAKLLANYQKNYKAKYIRKENDGTAVIDLTPKHRSSFYKIRMLINSSTGVVKSMTMHGYDSSSSEYKVSNFKTGVSTKEADFKFSTSAHPEVEVIDMR